MLLQKSGEITKIYYLAVMFQAVYLTNASVKHYVHDIPKAISNILGRFQS